MATRRHASLKPQLGQIRDWVSQGATDIWIAHQLDSTPSSIATFRRQHGVYRDARGTGSADELEVVEIDVAAATAVDADVEPAERRAEPAVQRAAATRDDEQDRGERRPRRRGRRGGKRAGEAAGGTDAAQPLVLEAVFDHGGEGYGLWLDGAVRDAAVYREHWAGKREISVTIGPDEIVIRRV